MSSSLISVGSIGASVVAAPGVPASGDSAPTTLMDVFSRLLANVGGDLGADASADITQSSNTTINGVGIKDAAHDIIAALLGGTGLAALLPQADADADAAASVDADPSAGPNTAASGAAATAAVEASPLSGLADLLAKIDEALKAGKPVDPDLLKKLGEAVDALAVLIGNPAAVSTNTSVPASLPADMDVTAAAQSTPAIPAVVPGGVAAEADVVQPALKQLADKLKDFGEKLEQVDGDLAKKLVALSDKLSTLKTDVAGALADSPELKAVLEALVQPKVEVKAAAVATFAAPQLRLPDNPSLSAKKVDGATATPTPSAAPPAEQDAAPAAADVADAPKLEVKADVKLEGSATAAPDKREAAPTAAPTQTQQAVSPDPSVPVAGATASASAHVVEHGSLRVAHTAYTAPSPINLPHVAFEIARQVQQGVSKFQIRLDPPELGRIDVKLDMDSTGQVNARLTVERAETLDLLQRDQRSLERALAQAGLDSSKTNLEFSLKQNPFAGQEGKGGQQTGFPFGPDVHAPALAEAEPQPSITVYRGTASASGVNIFV